jgi:hypothetical protein
MGSRNFSVLNPLIGCCVVTENTSTYRREMKQDSKVGTGAYSAEDRPERNLGAVHVVFWLPSYTFQGALGKF